MKSKDKHTLSLPTLPPLNYSSEQARRDYILSLYTPGNSIPITTTTSWTMPLSPKSPSSQTNKNTSKLMQTDITPSRVVKMQNPILFKGATAPSPIPTIDVPCDLKKSPTKVRVKYKLRKSSSVLRGEDDCKHVLPANWNLDWLLRSEMQEAKNKANKEKKYVEFKIPKRKFYGKETAIRYLVSPILINKFNELDEKLTKINEQEKIAIDKIYNKAQ